MKPARVGTYPWSDAAARSRSVRPRTAFWKIASVMLAMWMLLGAGMTNAQTIFKNGFEVEEAPNPGSLTLNDTGIVWSGDYPSDNATICTPNHPAGQDCHYGRDAQAAWGTLQKIGASTSNNGIENGFDYTKISNSGNALSANAPLGSGPNDWACTRDNVTGLTWEVKTSDGGLRDQNHSYSWYNSASPDGDLGTQSGGTCHQSGRCDTEKYVVDVNAQGLCGHSDWRMPRCMEVASIIDRGRSGTNIDPTYFPNTPPSLFWSSSPNGSSSSSACTAHFGWGNSDRYSRAYALRVRLARVGQ